ncbi:MAG: PHP domain-containing protein [Chloroflexi bacterium HGW-Chloroflexi-10]|nr:MAG: PHP domain-containing protein [Chloroflexi bacterium HGW-Chloroflexi-10]
MNLSTDGLVLASDAAIDLHLHTTYSDGRWAPEQLLDYLVREQFGLAAITDHDRTDTAAALQELAMEKHIPLLTAVEMTTVWHDEMSAQRIDAMSGLPEMTDLLCFGFDPGPSALNDIAQDQQRRQRENTQEVYENLLRKGYAFPESPDELAALLETPSPQQPHELAALLKRHGYGTGQPSAGRIILEAGCVFATNDLAAVVEAAHQSGAVCLVAHPGHAEGFVTYDAALLDKLRQEVAIDGLEVYQPKHTPEQAAMYLEYAQQHHLLISCGSDSHKPEKPPIRYPAELSRTLLERLGICIKV